MSELKSGICQFNKKHVYFIGCPTPLTTKEFNKKYFYKSYGDQNGAFIEKEFLIECILNNSITLNLEKSRQIIFESRENFLFFHLSIFNVNIIYDYICKNNYNKYDFPFDFIKETKNIYNRLLLNIKTRFNNPQKSINSIKCFLDSLNNDMRLVAEAL